MSNNIPIPESDRIVLIAKKIGRDDDFIEKIKKYAKNLEIREFPVIFSVKHFCLLSGFNYEKTSNLLQNISQQYLNKFLKKKHGGFRHIRAPSDALREVQKWVKEQILDKVEMNPCVTAYCRKRSIIQNASFHVNSELLVKIDLENFYDHIDKKNIYKIFRRLGYGKSISIFMSNLCCVYDENLNKTVLPQGACTSPTLSNLACKNMDLRLSAFAESNGFRYTRYCDDLTFSTEIKRNKLKYAEIVRIVKDSGFNINIRKTRFLSKKSRQTVTGLNVNNGVSIPKTFRKGIATQLHNCLRHGVEKHMQKANINKINYREWLLGNIIYISSVHFEQGKLLREKFNRINWIY